MLQNFGALSAGAAGLHKVGLVSAVQVAMRLFLLLYTSLIQCLSFDGKMQKKLVLHSCQLKHGAIVPLTFA